MQDEWRFAKDWQLTGGVRYDTYSDFGDTVNPRAALIWETRQDLTTKLMYGSAFRAPSFNELYVINNPVSQGNPGVKPETLDTVELAFDYRPGDRLRLGLNIFQYWLGDIIQFVPNATSFPAQNVGKQSGIGGELEVEWQADDTLKLTGHYAYQNATDDTHRQTAGNAPSDQIYLRADWDFLPHWQFSPQIKWIGGRSRPYGDLRPAIDDYAWVDITLRRRHLYDHWEIAFSMRNLLDADAREPSLSGPPAPIPNDLPLAGRSLYGEIRFNF